MTAGRIRFRYPRKPWGPWFEYVENPDDPSGLLLRLRPPHYVRLSAWRTDHVYKCAACPTSWHDGPGVLAVTTACPRCESVYWRWVTWPGR